MCLSYSSKWFHLAKVYILSLRPSLNFILIARIPQLMIRIDKMVRTYHKWPWTFLCKVLSFPNFLVRMYRRWPWTKEQGLRFPWPYMIRWMIKKNCFFGRYSCFLFRFQPAQLPLSLACQLILVCFSGIIYLRN